MSHHEGTTIKDLVKLSKDPNDCWIWLGRVDAAGYAVKMHRGKSMTAARWMYETLHGKLPDGFVIRNTCDNKQCSNPFHGQVTTMTGAKREGITTTLTTADVHEIKQAKKNRTMHTAKHLADKFGVLPGAIRAVWNGDTWRERAKRPRDAVAPSQSA